MEGLFVDGSIVSAHAMGDRGHKDEVINQSCGGNSTKIHLAVDSYGLSNHCLLYTSDAADEKIFSFKLLSCWF